MNDLTVFVITFFNQRGLDFDANVIVGKLISSGILIVEGGVVAFRYKCFQEYFVATRLSEKSAELEKIITGSELLLYEREVELLTGLSRTHEQVVSVLYDKVTELKPKWLDDIKLDDFDRVKLLTPATELEKRVAQMKTKHLSSDEVDDFVEHTERRFLEEARDPKMESRVSQMETPDDERATAPTIFLRVLTLFGKVVRNTEFIGSDEKERAVRLFYTVVSELILLWVKIFNTIVKDVREEEPSVAAITPARIGKLEYMIKAMIFVLLSQGFDECIASPKLSPIFQQIAYKRNTPTIMRILSTFTLLDCDHKQWLKNFRTLLKDLKKRTPMHLKL